MSRGPSHASRQAQHAGEPPLPAAPHVGLNLIFLVPGDTGGMEVYARELLPSLVAAAPSVRFTAFLSREAATAGVAPWRRFADTVTVPISASHRMQWVLGEQALLPRLASRAGVDLVHSLASTAPAWGSFRRTVTVHDLVYARHPEAHGGARSLGMRVLVPLAVRRSDRVIAISQSTSDDLRDVLRTPERKIDVVPQGVGRAPSAATASPAETRARLQVGERRVLLCLSAKRPHKNLLALIGALSRIPLERRPLVLLPGYPTWHEATLRERCAELGLDGDVRLLGWIPDAEVEELWAAADAFVYPSLYEGFGLPVLEAMARGVPVACSNVSSLPEVAGDAALLFDPHDERAIASTIERLLGDEATAERLREAGLARARQFTWRRTAELTLLSYARALGHGDVPRSWRAPR